jgi:hypothetical protein
MCGRDGGPLTGCNMCKGAERFRVASVGATLSDYRSGRVKDERTLGPKQNDSTWQGTNGG